MFLCEPCHSASTCTWPSFLEPGSRGACECCHEVANCTDCHGYDFRGTGHSHAAPSEQTTAVSDDTLRPDANSESTLGPS